MNTISNHFKQQLKRVGIEATLIDIKTKVIVREIEEQKNSDSKIIIFQKNLVNQGDIIKLLNRDWIISDVPINYNGIYDACIATVCTTYKIVINGDLYVFKGFLDSISPMDTLVSKVVDVTSGDIKITTYDNTITRQIKAGDRFITMGKAWEVRGTSIEKAGLLYIYAKIVSIVSGDDIENEIADTDKLIKYTIEASDVEVTKDGTSIINAKLFANGVEVSNPNLSYTVLDTNICTVLEDGTVNGLNAGNTTITITHEDKATKVINIVVKVIQVENLGLTILGNPTQYRRTEQVYNAKLTNNGADVTSDYTYNWSITNKDSTSNIYATIKSISPLPFGKDCTVLTKELADKFIILTCECREKPHLTFSKEIEIIDIF